MNKEEALNKIKELQQFVEELNKKQQKVDFSRFIGRFTSTLVIKGKKYLKCYGNKAISYDNNYKGVYNNELHYEEIFHTELEEGDVYYAGSLERAKKGIKLSDFRIHFGFDNTGISVGYFLSNYLVYETIDNTFYAGRVVRFLRK